MVSLLCVLCLVVGALFGAFLAGKPGRRRSEAPEPVLDMEYDLSNPINARGLQRGETDPETGLTRLW